MTRVAVISDTHMPRRARDLPAGAWRLIDSASLVIHAGDVTERSVLERITAHRPVHAVRGNNDLALPDLPDTLWLDIGGVGVAVVHDSGARIGRRERLARAFPDARVVVFGHSHVPCCEDDGRLLLLNPGSPTDRRSTPTFTMAILELGDGNARAELVDLGLERASVPAPLG